MAPISIIEVTLCYKNNKIGVDDMNTLQIWVTTLAWNKELWLDGSQD